MRQRGWGMLVLDRLNHIALKCVVWCMGLSLKPSQFILSIGNCANLVTRARYHLSLHQIHNVQSKYRVLEHKNLWKCYLCGWTTQQQTPYTTGGFCQFFSFHSFLSFLAARELKETGVTTSCQHCFKPMWPGGCLAGGFLLDADLAMHSRTSEGRTSTCERERGGLQLC